MAVKTRKRKPIVTKRTLSKLEALIFAGVRGGKPRQAWPGSRMSVTLDIDLSKFIALPALAIAGMNEGILDAVEQITEKARLDAPELTGELKASGRYVELQNDSNAVSYEIRFGDDLPDARAVFQEFGTVHHGPQAYLYPAVKAIKVGKIVSKAIEKRIKTG